MSYTLQTATIKQVLITPENNITFKRGGSGDSNKDESVDSLDIKNSVVQIDYFEDLLSPAITVRLLCSDTAALLSLIPIRGYERIDLIVGTSYGDVKFTEENGNPLYVSSIEKVSQVEGQETFTLKCCTLTNLSNETTRVVRRYEKAPISEHVKNILTDVLQIDEDRMSIEKSLTSYGFIGNMRKPFYTIQWLCPKAVPTTSTVSGTSGKGVKAEGKGTSGFFFYEDYDGYKFRSVDKMVDATQVKYPDDGEKLESEYGIPTYTHSTLITSNDESNNYKILFASIDKTTDLQKNLRVGLYSNLTYVYDPLKWNLDVVKYSLKDNVDQDNLNKAGEEVPIPQGDITDYASRTLVRMGDRGMWNLGLEESAEDVEGQGRDPSDMAKAFTRYSMLFQQSLNISVPCNPLLRVGGIVRVELPEVGDTHSGGPRGQKKTDSGQSGFFVIRSVRHHFEITEGRNVSSLNLIRDSYGIQ
tara:strand:- start:1111 stop:2526 length:1416 start_codon:yes stop_codon:yes gene_type:complete